MLYTLFWIKKDLGMEEERRTPALCDLWHVSRGGAAPRKKQGKNDGSRCSLMPKDTVPGTLVQQVQG